MSTKPMCIDRGLPVSKAWLGLRGTAAQTVYLILLMRRKFKQVEGKKRINKKWVMTNNGDIVFPYAEAKNKFGMSDGVFRRAIRDLRNKGFIEYDSPNFKKCNKFTLLEKWRCYGTDVFEPPKPKVKRYKCMGFQEGNKHGKNSKK